MEKEDIKLGIDIAAKGFLNTLPVVGSLFAELYDIRKKLYQNRINQIVELLYEKVADIELILSQKLVSENFVDICREVVTTSTKTSSESKHKALAAILIDNLETENGEENYDLSLTFIRFINEFTENHLLILKYLHKYQSELVEIGSYNSLFEKFTTAHKQPFDKYEFKFYCEDLRTKGLISMEAGLNDFDKKSAYRLLEGHKDASVFVTSFGDKFISYLLDNEEVVSLTDEQKEILKSRHEAMKANPERRMTWEEAKSKS